MRLEPHRAPLGAALGGLGATAVDVCVLAALVHVGARLGWAAFAGAVVGGAIGFVVNKRAFGCRRATTPSLIARFAGVALASAVLMALAMEFAVAHLALPYLTAKLACAALVFVGWSYPAQRRLVFAPTAI